MPNFNKIANGLLSGFGEATGMVGRSMIDREKEAAKAMREENMARFKHGLNMEMEDKRQENRLEVSDHNNELEEKRSEKAHDRTVKETMRQEGVASEAAEKIARAKFSKERFESYTSDRGKLRELKQKRVELETLQEKNDKDLNQYNLTDKDGKTVDVTGMSFEARKKLALEKQDELIAEEKAYLERTYPELSGANARRKQEREDFANKSFNTRSANRVENLLASNPEDVEKARKLIDRYPDRKDELLKINPDIYAAVFGDGASSSEALASEGIADDPVKKSAVEKAKGNKSGLLDDMASVDPEEYKRGGFLVSGPAAVVQHVGKSLKNSPGLF